MNERREERWEDDENELLENCLIYDKYVEYLKYNSVLLMQKQLNPYIEYFSKFGEISHSSSTFEQFHNSLFIS